MMTQQTKDWTACSAEDVRTVSSDQQHLGPVPNGAPRTCLAPGTLNDFLECIGLGTSSRELNGSASRPAHRNTGP